MAALLLQSIGQLCSGTYETCIAYPCRAGCECLRIGACSPFTPYLFATFTLNVPTIIWSLQSVIKAMQDPSCVAHSSKSWYLWTDGALALCHLIGSVYIVYRIGQTQQQKRDPDTYIPRTDVENSIRRYGANNEEETAPGSCSRVGHVLCYDAGVAVYVLLAAVWTVLQFIGLSMVFLSAGSDDYYYDDDATDYNDLCGNLKKWTMTSVICGLIYMAVVFFAFGCSLLCFRK